MTLLFFVLFLLVWMTAMGSLVYLYFYHERQRKILRYIALQLNALRESSHPQDKVETQDKAPLDPQPEPKKETVPETTMTIDKNDPISKYESMNLPDEVDVKFK